MDQHITQLVTGTSSSKFWYIFSLYEIIDSSFAEPVTIFWSVGAESGEPETPFVRVLRLGRKASKKIITTVLFIISHL